MGEADVRVAVGRVLAALREAGRSEGTIRRHQVVLDRFAAYTYPSRKAVKAVTGKVKTMCRDMDTSQPLDALLRQLNPALQGLVRLLPARRVQPHLRLPELLHVAAGRQLAAAQTPPVHLEGPPPPLLRRRMVARLGATITVQPGQGSHHALPLPGNSHPRSLAQPGMRNHTQDPDRACRAPGARKRARRVREAVRGNGPVDKAGTAPRTDFTTHISALMRTFIEAHDQWLTVARLPAYAPELNAVEGAWANMKNSLGNLGSCATPRQLAAIMKNRLKRIQYRPALIEGFLAQTGLSIGPQPP